MILDHDGIPMRRRIGFLPAWEREGASRSVELVSAVAFSDIEPESEAEGTDEHDER